MSELEWQHMDEVPRDGTEIIGKYGSEECDVFWSDDRT